jgi:hypothetical protein
MAWREGIMGNEITVTMGDVLFIIFLAWLFLKK